MFFTFSNTPSEAKAY